MQVIPTEGSNTWHTYSESIAEMFCCTYLCLVYRSAQSLALGGHLGLDHMAVNKWIKGL